MAHADSLDFSILKITSGDTILTRDGQSELNLDTPLAAVQTPAISCRYKVFPANTTTRLAVRNYQNSLTTFFLLHTEQINHFLDTASIWE
jgi:hypothetical protein